MASFWDNLVQGTEQGVGGFFGAVKQGIQYGAQGTGEVLNAVNKLPQTPIGHALIGSQQQEEATGTGTLTGIAQGIPGPGTGMATSVGEIEDAAQGATKVLQGAGGFFNGLKNIATRAITPEDVSSIKNAVASQAGNLSLPFKDGEKLSGDQNTLDEYTKAQAQAQKSTMAQFTENPGGPDTQYIFSNLKNPDGLLKSLSKQGVAASYDSNGNVVAHDTDNLAKSIINQVTKEGHLEPPTAIKGDVHIVEGEPNAATNEQTIQPNAQGTGSTLSNQAAKDSGGVQNPVLPAQPADTGGTSQGPVLSLFRGSKGQVEESQKQFGKVLEVGTSQNELLQKMADNGDTEAAALIGPRGKPTDTVKADDLIRQRYQGQYDAIKYNNSDRPQVGAEYQDLKAPRGQDFFAEQKVTASVYSKGRREAKYNITPAEQEMQKTLGLSDEQMLKAKAGMEGERLQPGDTPGIIAKDTVPQEVEGISQGNFARATGGKAEEPVTPQAPPGAKRRVGNLGKDLTPEERNALQTFMRDEKVVGQEAALEAKKFEPMREEGMEAIHAHQAGAQDGLHAQLTKLAKTTFQALKENAVPGSAWSKMKERENYLTQIWAGMKNPRAFLSRVYETYQEGIDAGLEPKYQNMPDLVKWYVTMANKAIAKGKFLNAMEKAERILPEGADGAEGLFELKGTGYVGPQPLADAYNNYKYPESTILTKIASVTRGIVRGVFSTGVPGTGLNFHIVANELPRKMLATSNIAHIPATGLVKGLLQAAPDILIPGRAAGILKENAQEVIEFQKGSEWTAHTPGDFAKGDQVVKGIVGKVLGKLGNVSQKAFTQPMSDIINAWQYNFIKTSVAKAVAGGMDRAEAIKTYGQVANKMFGTLNYNEMFRGQGAKNLADVIAQTPQFVESSFRLPAAMAKSVTTGAKAPEASAYRAIAGSAVSLYAIANVINKQTSGHWMYQNQPNHQFSIEFSSDGKGNTFPVFGSTGTLLNEVGTAGEKLAGGDLSGAASVLRNRLSPTTGLATDLVTNSNYAGNQLTSPKQTVAQNVGDVANTVGNAVLPIGVQSAIQAMTGQQSPAIAAARSAGIPITQPNQNPNFGTVAATQGTPFQQAINALTSGSSSNPLGGGGSSNPLAASTTSSSAKQASQRRAANAASSRARRAASYQRAAAGRRARASSAKAARLAKSSPRSAKLKSVRVGGRRRG